MATLAAITVHFLDFSLSPFIPSFLLLSPSWSFTSLFLFSFMIHFVVVPPDFGGRPRSLAEARDRTGKKRKKERKRGRPKGPKDMRSIKKVGTCRRCQGQNLDWRLSVEGAKCHNFVLSVLHGHKRNIVWKICHLWGDISVLCYLSLL